MRRLGPGKALSIGFTASLVLAVTVGASLLPAGGAPSNPKTNRFGPSGDAPGPGRLQAGILAI